MKNKILKEVFSNLDEVREIEYIKKAMEIYANYVSTACIENLYDSHQYYFDRARTSVMHTVWEYQGELLKDDTKL